MSNFFRKIVAHMKYYANLLDKITQLELKHGLVD